MVSLSSRVRAALVCSVLVAPCAAVMPLDSAEVAARGRRPGGPSRSRRGCRPRRTPPRRPRARARPRPRPGSGRPGRGGRRRTAAARRPSAARGCRPGGRVSPVASARSASDARDELLVGGLERGLLAVPAQRGAQVDDVAVEAPRRPSRTQSHLAKENVDGLDPRGPRPAARGSPEPVRRSRRRRPAARKASVTTATQADSTAASSAAARRRDVGRAAGRSGAAGVASTTASASSGSGRAWSEPTVSAQPRRRPRAAPGRSRRCAPRTGAVGDQRSGSRPMPPGEAGEDRGVATAAAAAAALQQRAARRASRAAGARRRGAESRARGRRTPRRAAARPAGRRPRRRAGRRPGRRPRRRRRRGRRQRGSARDPGQPLGGEHAGGGQLVEVERHAHQRARQRAQRAAGPHPRRRRRRVHDLQAELARPARAPSGRRLSIASAPTSTVTPADLGAAELAADARASPRAGGRRPGGGEVAGGGQTGDAAPDDGGTGARAASTTSG